jgi:hypothetical protein
VYITQSGFRHAISNGNDKDEVVHYDHRWTAGTGWFAYFLSTMHSFSFALNKNVFYPVAENILDTIYRNKTFCYICHARTEKNATFNDMRILVLSLKQAR